jgi:hypothetical protein
MLTEEARIGLQPINHDGLKADKLIGVRQIVKSAGVILSGGVEVRPRWGLWTHFN